MEQRLLQTKQDYIDLCKSEEILNVSLKYGSTQVIIHNSKPLNKAITFDNGYIGYIAHEPISYPCIFVWSPVDGDIFCTCIYPNDFK